MGTTILSNFDALFNMVMNAMPEIYVLSKDLNYARLTLILGVICGLISLGYFFYTFIDTKFFKNTGLSRGFMILLIIGSIFIIGKGYMNASRINDRIVSIKSKMLSQIDYYIEEENEIAIFDGSYRIDMTPKEKYEALYKFYEREVVREIYSRYKSFRE